MLLMRADSNKIIKPCLKITCTHFNEITCTKVISHQCLYKQSAWVFNPNITTLIFSQDIINVDLFTAPLSFMLLWML